MCKNLTEGGKRCAAHTRPRYEEATFGTAEWDRAAAEYAATPSGRKALTEAQQEAEQAGDVERAVALTHALTEGARLADTAVAVRAALTSDASPVERFAPIEDSLRAIATNLGYRRTLIRPNPGTPAIGTLVFQQGSRSTEIPYSLHTEGIALRLKSADLTSSTEVSPLAEHEFRAPWGNEEALTGLARQVQTVLERRRDPSTPTGPSEQPMAPATVAELEAAFTTLGEDLGYTRVRISDVPDGVSKYVDFLRPKPAKSRRVRYYATPDGWTVRVKGHYRRLATRAQARQRDTELTISSTWDNETGSVEALGVLRDLFDALP